MRRRVLLLGDTGKLGTALRGALDPGAEVVGASRRNLDAADFGAVERRVDEVRPDLVFNAVAMLGIDACEREPERAFRLNALLPRLLAKLSAGRGFGLVHFGTDAVFDGEGGEPFTERSVPRPPNVYGATKLAGDCLVLAEAPRARVVRVSLLFGPGGRGDQFVERMLAKAKGGGEALRVADDLVLSPTFTPDAARAAVALASEEAAPGLYHLANDGRASLFGLVRRIAGNLRLPVRIEPASHREFPSAGRKNRFSPIRSERIAPMRRWEDAVDEYCAGLANGEKSIG
jgi:dTDP-4-dehydrorhamnose reductase